MKNVLFMISRLTIFCLTSLLLFNQIFSLCSILVKKSDLNGQNLALIHKNVPCFSKSDEIFLSQNERLSHCTIGLLTPNRYAKITYGNKSDSKKGLKNLHLNIRSLKNKVSEVKNIIKAEKPHIFGLSECEMRKSKNGRQTRDWGARRLLMTPYCCTFSFFQALNIRYLSWPRFF